MTTLTLIQKLESLATSTPEAAAMLKKLFVPAPFRAGVSFPWHEQSAHILYFIETGLVRGYIYYKGEQYSCWVMENGFMLPVNESLNAVEFEHSEFMEDTQAWALNLEKAQVLAQTEPVLYQMLFEILKECMLDGKIREFIVRLRSAEEQFLFMRKHNAALLRRIPHPVLASLLNVTTKYLYDLKKKHPEKSDFSI